MKQLAENMFEEWAKKQLRYPVHNPDFKKNNDDEYTNDYVQGDWEAFKEGFNTALAFAMAKCTEEYNVCHALELDGDSRAGIACGTAIDLRASLRVLQYRSKYEQPLANPEAKLKEKNGG